MSQVVQCDACGGAVAYDAADEQAACLFCASVTLRADDLDESVPTPGSMLPFELDRDEADKQFRRWARSSWWYAEPLRRLELELNPMLLPIWRFEASLETHWAGLVSAPGTRNGSRPRSGVEHAQLGTVVPASMGLRAEELDAVMPFREGAAVRFDSSLPHEIPGLTERAASERARESLLEEHRNRIARARKLTRCNANTVIRVREAQLLMVPIYIASLRFRDRPWRLVINGQTGAVTGKAPLDRRKVAFVVALVIAVVLAIVWFSAR